MNRTLKVGLIVVGMFLVLCCLVLLVGAFFLKNTLEQSFITDPAEARRIGRQIIEYEPPPGYQESGALTLMGFQVVFIMPMQDNESGMIFLLVSSPESGQLDEATMRQAIEEQLGRRVENARVVETRTVTIRGQEHSLIITEGKDVNSGQVMRQAFVAFEGNQGPALVMAIGATDTWDEEALDAFIASLK